MTEMILYAQLFLIVGVLAGWFASDKFKEYAEKTRHHFQELFDENPHPEIYNEDGDIDKGDYMVVNFELGYDPDGFDPEDIIETWQAGPAPL